MPGVRQMSSNRATGGTLLRASRVLDRRSASASTCLSFWRNGTRLKEMGL
jgi:hypothetical protein